MDRWVDSHVNLMRCNDAISLLTLIKTDNFPEDVRIKLASIKPTEIFRLKSRVGSLHIRIH